MFNKQIMESTDITFKVFKGSESGSILEAKTTRPILAGDQVLIAITASGLCGGDLMFKNNDARLSTFRLLTISNEHSRWSSVTKASAS